MVGSNISVEIKKVNVKVKVNFSKRKEPPPRILKDTGSVSFL